MVVKSCFCTLVCPSLLCDRVLTAKKVATSNKKKKSIIKFTHCGKCQKKFGWIVYSICWHGKVSFNPSYTNWVTIRVTVGHSTDSKLQLWLPGNLSLELSVRLHNCSYKNKTKQKWRGWVGHYVHFDWKVKEEKKWTLFQQVSLHSIENGMSFVGQCSPVGLRSSNGMRMCVCMCVWTEWI